MGAADNGIILLGRALTFLPTVGSAGKDSVSLQKTVDSQKELVYDYVASTRQVAPHSTVRYKPRTVSVRTL